MVRVPSGLYGARYAQWLADLSKALDEARRVAKRLGAADGKYDAVELYARIEALRLEVEALRIGRKYSAGADFDPNWTELLPWQRDRRRRS